MSSSFESFITKDFRFLYNQNSFKRTRNLNPQLFVEYINPDILVEEYRYVE